MKLAIVVLGTRGDVEPPIALGRDLALAGHDITFATHEMFRGLVEGSGLKFHGIRGRSPQDLAETPEARELAQSARNPLTLLQRIRALRDIAVPDLKLIYEDSLSAVDGADAVLVYSHTYPALDAAAHLGLPVVHVHVVPRVPTSEFPAPPPYLDVRTLTAAGNRFSYGLDTLLAWGAFRGTLEPARREVLGCAPRTAREALAQAHDCVGALVGVSPAVLPRPRDWPSHVVSCGYWWLNRPSEAPPALDDATERFLAAGMPPVFFSLGSAPVSDPRAFTDGVVGAARDAGVRLILQRGWAGLGEGVEAEDIHLVDSVPYGALFGRVAAVAHHGGAGTSAYGLLHAKPTLMVPLVADQFFWSHRVGALGVGPAPLAARHVTRQKLAQRFSALVTTPSYAQRAAAIAERLALEDGGAVAVRAIERFFGKPPARTPSGSRFRRDTTSVESDFSDSAMQAPSTS